MSYSSKKFVLIPCNIYRGQIHVKKRESLFFFHKIVIRLIARNHNLTEVMSALGINPRIINSVLIDLLYKNLVYLDLNNNIVELIPELSKVIEENTLDEFLQEQTPIRINVEWVQERITGKLVSLDLVDDFFFNIDEIDENELIDLRNSGIEKITPIQEYSPQKLVKAVKFFVKGKISDEHGEISELVDRVSDIVLIRNQPLILPIKQENIDGKPVYFIEARHLPDSFIESLTNKLNNEVVVFSSDYLEPVIDPFVEFTFTGVSNEWQNIFDQIRKILSDKVKKKSKIFFAKGILSELDKNEHILWEKPREQINSINEVNSYFFSGENILKDLKTEFTLVEDFLIIGSAFFSNIGLAKLKNSIIKLIDKNKKIILIWGLANLEDKNTINDRIEEARNILNIESENLVIIPSQESFHSKFLVRDGEICWITSCNLLNTNFESETIEAVAVITGGNIQDSLLEYAITKLEKNSEIRQYLENKREVLKRTYLEKLNEERKDLINKLENSYFNIKSCIENYIENPDEMHLAKLKDLYSEMKAILKEIKRLPTAQLIENLDHRRFLLSALTNVQNQVLIASDRINDNAITPPLRKHLRSLLEKKIQITIRWGRETTITEQNKSEINQIIRSIEKLERDLENKLSIPKKPAGIHAKLLIIDSSIIMITSYNLLAFGGTKPNDNTISGELGIVINSKKETSKLRENLK